MQKLSLVLIGAVALALQVTLAQESASLAFRNVTVIPATGGDPLPSMTVIVRGERIAAIGPTDNVAIPPDTRVVDGTGRYLLPGFIDMHAHLSKVRASSLGLFVANGVTTVRDMGGDYEELRQWRREVTAGTRLGPRIVMPGPILESTANIARMRKDPPTERVEPFERMRIGIGSPDEARLAVARLAMMDVDFIKIRTAHDRATYLALNEAANAHGIPLVGHVYAFPPQVVLEARQDGIDHSFADLAKLSRAEKMALWRRFAAAGVPITPTIVTLEASLAPIEHLRALIDDHAGATEPRRRYLSKFLIADWREQVLETSAERQQMLRSNRAQSLADLREMHDAGMDLLTGTDVGVLNVYPGSSLLDEIVIFVKELGMTPAEALERATRRPARFLRLGDSIGTVERGKVADLVLLDGDPLADIANIRRISAVVLRSQFHDRESLDRIRAQVLASADLQTDEWGRR